jgi:hypothetical protein
MVISYTSHSLLKESRLKAGDMYRPNDEVPM